MVEIKDVPKLAPRDKDAYKNSFGRVLLIGASVGLSGAICLSGVAALRSGAGLVEVATAKSVWPIVAGYHPGYMASPLSDVGGKISYAAIFELEDKVSRCDVVGFGPGIGVSRDVVDVLRWLISNDDTDVVIDADGLNCLSKIRDWHEINNANLILTPHPGEFRRLWSSVFRVEMPESRIEAALEFSSKTKTTLILKGSETVVTSNGYYYINKTGNPGMATAGSGDVLTGVVAALWAQWKLSKKEASALSPSIAAVFMHAKAGDIAAEKFGEVSLIATDIIDSLPDAFSLYG